MKYVLSIDQCKQIMRERKLRNFDDVFMETAQSLEWHMDRALEENAKLKEALRVFKKLSDEMQADTERQQVFDLLGQELWMEI